MEFTKNVSKPFYNNWIDDKDRKVKSVFNISKLNYETLFPPKEGIEIRTFKKLN